MQCIKITGPGAIPESQASIGASLDVGDQVGGRAGHIADVFKAFESIVIMGLAVNDGPPGQALADLHPHDLGNGLGAAFTAHGTFVDGLVFQGDGFGIIAASYITTPTAIGAGQRIVDGDDPLVFFHIEFFAGPSKDIGEHHRHYKHGSGGEADG